jgi:hypothetical protein
MSSEYDEPQWSAVGVRSEGGDAAGGRRMSPREVVGDSAGRRRLVFIPVAALRGRGGRHRLKPARWRWLVASLPLSGAFAIVVALTVFKYRSRWSALGFRPFPLKMAWVPAAIVIVAFVIVEAYAVIARAIGGDRFLPQSTLGEDVFR